MMKLRSGKDFCPLKGSYRYCSDNVACANLVMEWHQIINSRYYAQYLQDIESMKSLQLALFAKYQHNTTFYNHLFNSRSSRKKGI